jgi:hypothetical protein
MRGCERGGAEGLDRVAAGGGTEKRGRRVGGEVR